MPRDLHEAADFVLGVGQAIPYLSDRARHDLRGKILGGLKTNGLRPLQHEFRIAGALSRYGYDVAFADLEGGQGGFDFLAQRDGMDFEVEGKCVRILRTSNSSDDAEKFFLALRRSFNGWSDGSSTPILDIRLTKRLDVDHSAIAGLIEACNRSARERTTVARGDYATVKFLGAAPEEANDFLIRTVHLDRLSTRANVLISPTKPKMVVRLTSEQRNKFVPKVLATLSEAAKRQFSGCRPGVIWLHVDYLHPAMFDALAHRTDGPSFFDLIALAVLDSPKRSHISQLILSGGSHLSRRGQYATSQFRSVVYDSPQCRFGSARLFPGGKHITSPKALMGEQAKSALKVAQLSFGIASGPKETSVAVTEAFLQHLSASSERRERLIALSVLFSRALRLGEQGRSAEAVEVYDRMLSPLPDTDDDSSAEMIATALFNRGNMLGELGRHDDALATYEMVVAQFGESSAAEVSEKVAFALFNSAKVLERDPARREDAIKTYEQICERGSTFPAVCPQVTVAQSYVNMGLLLGTSEAALRAWDEVVVRFSNALDNELREQVKKALVNKGAVLTALQRPAEAVDAFDAALLHQSFLKSDIELWALVRKIQLLPLLRREHEVPDLCDDLLASITPTTDLQLREASAKALLAKATVLRDRDDRAGEMATYVALVSRFGLDADQEIVRLVIAAQEMRVETLMLLDRCADILPVCDDIVSRCASKAAQPDFFEHAAWALSMKASALAREERCVDAVQTCSEIILRFGPDSPTPLPARAVCALAARAAYLHDLGRYDDALADCDAVLAYHEWPTKPQILADVAFVLLTKGSCLLGTEREAGAESVLESLIASFGAQEEQPFADYVTAARNILSANHDGCG